MPSARLGIVGWASPLLSATELDRPQPPPSWGRFFVSFLGRSKAEFNGIGGLRTYTQTRAGSLRHVYLQGTASARPRAGAVSFGRSLSGTGRIRPLAISKQLASKTLFNGVGRLRTYIGSHAFGVLVNSLWSFPRVEDLGNSEYRCEH
jgi:hypothetical protein